jgi:hypothetical protein
MGQGALRRDIDGLVEAYLRAYLDQVRQFLDVDDDSDFSLRLGTAHGAVEIPGVRSTRPLPPDMETYRGAAAC